MQLDTSSPAFLVVAFAVFWFGGAALMSRIAGWHALSALYPAPLHLRGQEIRFCSATLGSADFPITYRRCVRVLLTNEGIGLCLMMPFRFHSPPFLVPWACVTSCTERQTRGTVKVALSLSGTGRQPLPDRLARSFRLSIGHTPCVRPRWQGAGFEELTMKGVSGIRRKPIVLAPGEGRSYAMGRISAVFKADGPESDARYSISEWWLEPHTRGPGAHAHPEDDIFYVIEGTMSVLVDQEWTDASRGAFVLVPGGLIHDFENRGSVRAGVLNLSIPGPFEPHMTGIVQWFAEHPPGRTGS